MTLWRFFDSTFDQRTSLSINWYFFLPLKTGYHRVVRSVMPMNRESRLPGKRRFHHPGDWSSPVKESVAFRNGYTVALAGIINPGVTVDQVIRDLYFVWKADLYLWLTYLDYRLWV